MARKREVELKSIWIAKVSGKLSRVRIEAVSKYGGWNAVNLETGRSVHIRGASRLRYKAAQGDEVPDV